MSFITSQIFSKKSGKLRCVWDVWKNCMKMNLSMKFTMGSQVEKAGEEMEGTVLKKLLEKAVKLDG